MIDYNINDGVIKISDIFDIYAPTQSINATPNFYQPNDEYILSFTNLENVIKFTNFKYDTLGINDGRYLLQWYRISRNGSSWTEWYELNSSIGNFPIIDSKDPLFIDIKWVRSGISTIGTIRLLEYELSGELERNITDDGSSVSISTGDNHIIKAPFIYKVFKLTDFEIISPTYPNGLPNTINLKWRYSQDSSRTWSEWEFLSKENISTSNISPIRFFQVEYLIENNSSSSVKIQDINLIGDFQNVSMDYQKSNLFGIRECCQSNMNGAYDENGNFIPNSNLNSAGGGSVCDTDVFKPMTPDEKAQLYNPYVQNTAVKLLEKLSNDAQEVFGHTVTYFVTDPDKKGQDHTLNEYQLYNIVCKGDLKVSIEGNNFPDSQIKMNVFDLDLFESMEAHITKQQFKQIFGHQRRPSKEDFLFFCNLNRMYQVDHSQQFRSFNNSAVSYKLILKKWTQKSNVQAGTFEIKNTLDQLTKNTTINELFGIEQSRDKAAVANKQQFTPLTRDPIRLEYFAQIDKELIENSSTIISKAHYDLSSVKYRSSAVRYKNLDPIVKKSDNIGYQIWFNINNYIDGEIYNLYNSYDSVNMLGWKSELDGDKIIVTMNSVEYVMDLTDSIEEEVWYCYVLNINQRMRNVEQFIWKRNVDDEDDAGSLPNNLLRRVYYSKLDMLEPHEWILEGIYPEILASDMKVTNTRLFIDIIPEEVHNKVLNQYIIRDDSKYLVFADNATNKLFLPRFPLNE